MVWNWQCRASNPSSIKVEIERTKIVLYIGTADIGQGSNTVLTQIATEELGIKTNEIHLVCADTASTMDTGPLPPVAKLIYLETR
jgi:CO/xanthine dehydrogenase Mo-binding subunit